MPKPTSKSKFRVSISGLTLYFTTFKGGGRKPDTSKVTTGDGKTYMLTSTEKIEEITLGIPYDPDTYGKLETFFTNFNPASPAILVVEQLDGSANKTSVITHEYSGVEPLTITGAPEVDKSSADTAMIEIQFFATDLKTKNVSSSV
jgi:hypothetical protein